MYLVVTVHNYAYIPYRRGERDAEITSNVSFIIILGYEMSYWLISVLLM